MRLTKSQGVMLARLISDLRSDWEFHGVNAALAKLDESEFAACQIAIACAADPSARTPAAMTNPIYRPDRSGPVIAVDDRTKAEHARQQRWRADLEAAGRKAATAEQIRNIREAGA